MNNVVDDHMKGTHTTKTGVKT